MKRIAAGMLRHLVELQKDTGTTKDGHYQHNESWVAFDAIQYRHAWIRQVGGREVEKARQLFAEATHLVTIRHVSGLTPAMRVKFGSKLFYIGAVNNLEQIGAFDELVCAELINV